VGAIGWFIRAYFLTEDNPNKPTGNICWSFQFNCFSLLRQMMLAWWLWRPHVGVKIVTWLILPVVICLSQRLSHACLSISNLYRETANGSLNQL
jgi:hypothetical protein